MSTIAQSLTTLHHELEAYRLRKARALTEALSKARTPIEALRFISAHIKTTELRQLQRVAEAALRAGL